MTYDQLLKQKKDLEQIKEYQCGDHPTRILCVSNISSKDLSFIHSSLNIDTSKLNNTNNTNQLNHPHIKSIFTDELEKYNFILISFYDLRQSISTHKMLLKTQKFQVHYALAKDVLDDKEQNQGTIVVFNIEYSVTNDDIKQLFSQCGDIKELRETPLKKHHRFVEYFDLRDAQKAINELNQYELKGRKLKIEPSRPYGIRQRVLTSCANVLGMSERMCGLPPPQEMMKFVCRKLKEFEYTNSNRNRNNGINAFNSINTSIDLNETRKNHASFTSSHSSNHNYNFNYNSSYTRSSSSNTFRSNHSNYNALNSNYNNNYNNSYNSNNTNGNNYHSKSYNSYNSYNSPIQSPSKSHANERKETKINKSPLTVSSSSSITLDCLSSLPSVSSQNDFNQFIQSNQFDKFEKSNSLNQYNNEEINQFEMQSKQNQMFYDLYQSSSSSSTEINNLTSNNLNEINEIENGKDINNFNNYNEMNKENEFKSIKPNQNIHSSSTSFSYTSSPSYTPRKQSHSAISFNQTNSLNSMNQTNSTKMKKKDDNSVINVPRPTTVGQELSKNYSKETIGTPHLPEKKYNHFTAIEMKGLGFESVEEIDEMKRVLVIENIPITFTYHELLNRIEQCISCFYDQFIPIKNSDGWTYKCIIRVTNQMVMDNFMLNFNGIFLENDQDDLCVVHEIECQGNTFSQQLNDLAM